MEYICLCAVCREMLFEGDDLVEAPVFKLGELAYVELMHAGCVREESK